MNLIDLAAIGVIAVAALLGWRSGFVSQVLVLAGLGAAILITIVVVRLAGDVLATLDPLPRAAAAIVIFVIALAVTQSVATRIATALRPRTPGARHAVDSLGGAALGVGRGIVFVWLLGGIVVAGPFPRAAVEARRSTILHAVDERLPSPFSVIADIGRIAAAAGLPELFVGAAPSTGPAVQGPPATEAARIASAAERSSVRVQAAACMRLQVGSGFAVGPGLFVTNAHVVAGGSQVELVPRGGQERFNADVVLFDPALDIAVLRAQDLAVPPLAFEATVPVRGDRGAAIGYPGGGPLTVIPAVVSRSLQLVGRDIYGGGVVDRQVLELQAAVAPGDSGGPLVLVDGRVGGVIFSQSRVQPGVGYALSPVAVAHAVSAAATLSEPVDTGACIAEHG